MHARTPGAHIHQSYDGDSENNALHLLDDDALRSLAKPRRAFPVLLLASIVAGVFCIALTRHLLAEAEQQAQIDAVISDIRSASTQPAPSTQGELERVQPMAEVPTSETLRAFQKLSVSADSPRSATTTRVSPKARPSQVSLVHKTKPAVRAVTKTTPSPRAKSRSGAERTNEPDLSDDPLRDL